MKLSSGISDTGSEAMYYMETNSKNKQMKQRLTNKHITEITGH